MHEGPDSLYLSDKSIDAIASDGPQGIQATEQKSSDRRKLFDGSDDTTGRKADMFTARSGGISCGPRRLPLGVRAAGLRSPFGSVVAFWQ
jgi:hypothetical protein